MLNLKSKKFTLPFTLPDDVSFSDILIGCMLIIVVGIMPLVVRLTIRPYPPELAAEAGAMYADFFSYAKSWFLGVPAVVIVFYYFSDLLTGGNVKETFKPRELIKNPVIIASAVFLFFMLLSALLSPFPYTSLHGTKDRNEGALTWIAYFMVFFSAMFYVRAPKFTKPILWGLTLSSIIMGLIGISQFIQEFPPFFVSFITRFDITHFLNRETPNFFDTTLASRLVRGDDEGLMTVFEIAHGTLFNPNTFGMYSAMVSPILLLSGFTYSGKRFVNVLLIFAGILMLFGVFASGSLAGMLGLIAAIGILVVAAIPTVIRHTNLRLWGLIGASIIITVAAFLFVPLLNDRANFLWDRLIVSVGGELRADDFSVSEDTFTIKRHDEIVASFTPIIEVSPNVEAPPLGVILDWVEVRDGNGTLIPLANRVPSLNEDGDVIQMNYLFDVPGYGQLALAHFGELFAYRNIFMIFAQDQIIGISRLRFGDLVDLSSPAPAWGFYRREAWGSGRGYIFSRTFPMMPRYAILGSGPDTYVNVFPNHDRIAILYANLGAYLIVDKAHNIYLQTWITKGGIAAIALIFLIGFYLVMTFLSLLRTKGEAVFTRGLRLGMLAGISAFAVSSLSTDSTIGSTGVFFVLLGMGYGLNMWVKANLPITLKYNT